MKNEQFYTLVYNYENLITLIGVYIFKGTVSVISSDPPFKDCKARSTL